MVRGSRTGKPLSEQASIQPLAWAEAGQKSIYRQFYPKNRSFYLLRRITYGKPERLCIFVLLKRANDPENAESRKLRPKAKPSKNQQNPEKN